jgi:hypothetical protein
VIYVKFGKESFGLRLERVRIPFPDRIPLFGAISFATLLFAIQLFQGTAALFAICCFLFIVIATVAFNLAGGFSRPSGAYVFFYAILAVILGLIWKAVLGERADSNLLMPQLTIEVFLGGITAMLAAVFISRKLTPKRGLLQDILPEYRIQNATVGCMATGLIVSGILFASPHTEGSFLSALAQVNRFLPMAVILGVVHEVRKSGGTRSVNLAALIAGLAIFAGGIATYSKEGIFTPLLCWLIAAASQRYRLSLFQVAAGVLVILFFVIYLVPYAQYGRDAEESHVAMLSDLGRVRKDYNETTAEQRVDDPSGGYFNTPQGFMDRLQMISVDDGLIDATERQGTFGFVPIITGFENLVPRFLWKDKPTIGYGNIYAHQMGGLSDDDSTTGISFTPTGEAYHIARWTGVFIVAPILWLALFIVFDSLCGDTRVSPWGLLLVAYFAHIAPEGMLGSIIYSYGFITFGLLVVAFSVAYVMPIIGTLIKGPEKTTLRRFRLLRVPESRIVVDGPPQA